MRAGDLSVDALFRRHFEGGECSDDESTQELLVGDSILIDIRFDVVWRTLGLLLDMRGAISNTFDGDLALLVARGVDRAVWDFDPVNTPLFNWTVGSHQLFEDDSGRHLRLWGVAFVAEIHASAFCAHIIEAPDMAKRAANYLDASAATIYERNPQWTTVGAPVANLQLGTCAGPAPRLPRSVQKRLG